MNDTATPSSADDFDFLIGRWRVSHRRLRRRLQGCTEWDTFGGTSEARKLMDGLANVDDNLIELPAGPYRAASLRVFDAKAAQWSIWWLDGRTPDRIDVPVRGAFAGGVGRFFADDDVDGRPIRVRFVWSRITQDGATWEQAFSDDAGSTWETNWIMDFARV
jgi:hypothetical protein